ncbi:MAG: hypothetical protein Gaeavirus17_7 [Gaeavirus sp.]|uniref:Uncharacterized protein n=1 Tax=Gaeavirus sp. TaxID=2487767 RepID=A0A3G5A203_9VIRU|nr:MAG: hypothetical protein Gaeavirus17_7 [Gaeavirus sp.]
MKKIEIYYYLKFESRRLVMLHITQTLFASRSERAMPFDYQVVDMLNDIRIFASDLVKSELTDRQRFGLYSSVNDLCDYIINGFHNCIGRDIVDANEFKNSTNNAEVRITNVSEYKIGLVLQRIDMTNVLNGLNILSDSYMKLHDSDVNATELMYVQSSFDFVTSTIANKLYDASKLIELSDIDDLSDDVVLKISELYDDFVKVRELYDDFVKVRKYIDNDSVIHDIYSRCVTLREAILDRFKRNGDDYFSHLIAHDLEDHKDMQRFVLLFWRLASEADLTDSECINLVDLIGIETDVTFHICIMKIKLSVLQMKYIITNILALLF